MESGDTSVSHDMREASHRNDHDPEESGKYDIGKQPPRKRRRKDKEVDKHTVFIDIDSGSDTDEVRVYDVDEDEDVKKGGKPLSDVDRKRNYWLSKGIGPGGDVSDDD